MRLDQLRPSPNLGSSSTGTPTRARPLHSTPWRSWRCSVTWETPNLAWDFLTLADPERWDAYFAAADQPRAEGADFWVHGRRYGLFAHDFRQVPMSALLERITERALAQDITPAQSTSMPALLVLSQPEFDDSVRQAMRDLRRPDLLARNSLLRTRLVHDRAGDEELTVETLKTLLSAAVETLREHPRDDKLWRAVERTYVRPAATQERAPRHWGCRLAHTAATSARAWIGSWLGCGIRRSTASITEHNRAASRSGNRAI